MHFKKLLAAAAIGAAFIGGSLATTPALAQHYHGSYNHGGGYYGGWHGGGYYGGYGGWRGGYWGPGIGFYFGPGYYPGDYWGGGYYPGYYGYPYPAADAGPQTYVEQGQQQQAQQQQEPYSWYRCDSANGTYYPYVKTCPGGWTKVAPSAPQ